MQPIVIAGIIFVAVATAVYGFFMMHSQGKARGQVRDRLMQKHVASPENDSVDTNTILRQTSYSEIGLLNRMLEGKWFAGQLRLWLLQARITAPPGTVVIGTVVLAVAGFGLGQTTGRIMPAVAGAVVLGGLPLFYVWRKRRKRFKAFAQQLPDALTMMKNSLQAGHTLPKAMQVIAEELPDPVALEFRETVEELHLGGTVKKALGNLASRVQDENLNIFVAAVLVQREIGGNLTDLLGNLSNTIRERFRVEMEVKALTAEGRISGWIVGFLPIGLAFVINLMQPSYLKPLYTTDGGITLLKVAAGLEIVGFYFINKASKVNF